MMLESPPPCYPSTVSALLSLFTVSRGCTGLYLRRGILVIKIRAGEPLVEFNLSTSQRQKMSPRKDTPHPQRKRKEAASE